MKIYGHPRSGVNFALALVGKAFTGKLVFTKVGTGHWSKRVTVQAPNTHLCGFHSFFDRRLSRPRIYVSRDGRDVA